MELLWPGSPIIFLLAWFGWRIAAKAGYSGFWGLTALIPPVGLLALWYLAANRDWPSVQPAENPDSQPVRSDTGGVTIRRPGGAVRER